MKEEIRLLWPFYVDEFLSNVLFVIIPFATLYFISIGLNIAQIGILIALWPLAALLTDIPTGAIADIYGRKFSCLLGYALMGVVFMTIPFLHSYALLLIAYALMGVFYTFTTGSYEAWAVDLLKKKRRSNLIKNYFSRSQTLYATASVFSGIIGGVLVALYGLKSIWFVSAFAYFVAIFILSFAQEDYVKKKIQLKDSFKSVFVQARKAIKYSYNHHVLFFILFAVFVICITETLCSFLSWTPFLKSFDFNDANFGYLFSFMSLVGVIASFFSLKFSGKGLEKKTLIVNSILWIVFGIFMFFIFNIQLAIIALLFSSFLFHFGEPIMKTYMHRFISSKMRATIGSIESTIYSLAEIIAYPLAGFLIVFAGARSTIALSGLLMIIVLVLFLRIKEKK